MTCHACQGGAYLSQLTREGSVVTVKGPAPVVVCTASGIRINLGSHIYRMAKYVCVYIAYWLVQVVEAEPGLGFLQDPLAVSAMDAPDMDRP